MPETIQALGVIILAVLPGVAATITWESHVGTYAADFEERLLRFILATVLVLPISGYLAWKAWTEILHVRTPTGTFENLLVSETGSLPWWWLLLAFLYVAGPAAFGWIGGRLWASAKPWLIKKGWINADLGEDTTAWDWLFLDPPNPGWLVRFRAKSNAYWQAGIYGPNSFASGKKAANKDLYLERTVTLTPEGLPSLDNEGNLVTQEVGLLVRRDELELLEFRRLS